MSASLHAELDGSPYLQLHSLRECTELGLELILLEMNVSHEAPASNLVAGARPVMLNSQKRCFRMIFPEYVHFAVANESYYSASAAENFRGMLFREYTQSRFLEYVHASCEYLPELLPSLRHFQIICIDHVVNVAAGQAPDLSMLAADERDAIFLSFKKDVEQ